MPARPDSSSIPPLHLLSSAAPPQAQQEGSTHEGAYSRKRGSSWATLEPAGLSQVCSVGSEEAGLYHQAFLHLTRLSLWVRAGFVDGLELAARTAVTVMVGHVSRAYSDGALYCRERKLRLWEEMTSHGGPDLGKAGWGQYVQGMQPPSVKFVVNTVPSLGAPQAHCPPQLPLSSACWDWLQGVPKDKEGQRGQSSMGERPAGVGGGPGVTGGRDLKGTPCLPLQQLSLGDTTVRPCTPFLASTAL